MFEPYHKLVYVLGDIHGEFGALNSFINKEIRGNKQIRTLAANLKAKGIELEVLFLQAGDFGFYWPGKNNSVAIKNVSLLRSIALRRTTAPHFLNRYTVSTQGNVPSRKGVLAPGGACRRR